jgi:hypothetical protein
MKTVLSGVRRKDPPMVKSKELRSERVLREAYNTAQLPQKSD